MAAPPAAPLPSAAIGAIGTGDAIGTDGTDGAGGAIGTGGLLRAIAAIGALVLALLVAPSLAPTAAAQAPARASPADAPLEPEAATGYAEHAPVRAARFMAVTANPYATRAAYDVLAAGGSAVDAAIAAQMVLTLVEPQSSGIGGGAFLLAYDARTRHVRAYDGRETAPAQATPQLFLDADGRPMTFFEAAVGGRAVGVPGVVRMLELAHARHGRLPWARLFEPAIRLAREGFEVSPRLHRLLEADRYLRGDPAAAAYFYDAQGRARPVGHRLRNPALADTLSRIAAGGSLALHAGPIAADIVAAVRGDPRGPGLLGERDLAFYRARERTPVCFAHRRYRICGMPPPSSGGIAIEQMLAYWRMASPGLRLAAPAGTLDADGVHRFTEAARLAYADRDRYVADTDFVALPGQRPGEAVSAAPGTLLDPAYLAARAALIGARSMGRAEPGTPGRAAAQPGAPPRPEHPSTTHLSIVDARGNAVSMTSSIENAFGARLMVRGFLLNNQLTDFSFVPTHDGHAQADRVEPGKRPRSAMSPTLVLERAGGGLALVIGSPGGPAIICYVAQTLVELLDDGLDLQRAVATPHACSINGPTLLERGRADAALDAALQARGHAVRRIEMTSGLHGIARRCDARGCTLTSGVDPRREGSALGR
ncbi:MAG: gamma-glutamyltransferase family protein [Burkholderiales bacterium]|nr:gamma-glutamyltransferase family protein [Burkholderiales bacterium]